MFMFKRLKRLKRLKKILTKITLTSLLIASSLTNVGESQVTVQTQGLPARFIATFPGTGVESSAVLGEILKTVTKSGGTVTFLGQADDETPVTITLDREIFEPSSTSSLVTPTEQMFEDGRVTFWNGEVYSIARTLEHAAVPTLDIQWSDYADTTFNGTVDSTNDLIGICTSTTSDHFYYVRDQLHGWYECVRVGLLNYSLVNQNPTSYGSQTAQVIGRFAKRTRC